MSSSRRVCLAIALLHCSDLEDVLDMQVNLEMGVAVGAEGSLTCTFGVDRGLGGRSWAEVEWSSL